MSFNTGGIYIIRNMITGSMYVGQSTMLQQRFRLHRSDLRLRKHRNVHLQRAWDKYGEAAFEFRVMEEGPGPLLPLEKAYGDFFKDNGFKLYNLSGIGYGRETTSDETRAKLSAASKGRSVPQERRDRISASLRGRVGHSLGKKLTPEHVQKLRDAHLGKPGGHTQPHTYATRKKISNKLRGRKWSDAERIAHLAANALKRGIK